MKLKKIKLFLKESPYLFDTRMNLEKLTSLSRDSIEENFKHLGRVKVQNFDLYENKTNGSILGGVMIEDEFYSIISITCEERSLFVKSMQLSDKRKHVKMLRTDESFATQKVALDTYTFIAEKFDLISDRIQYKGAKVLWKSLARQNQINVYVFDEEEKDYLRDEEGK